MQYAAVEALKWRKLRQALHTETPALGPFQLHCLGSGAFSQGVYKATSRKHGVIAIKVVKLTHVDSLRREVALLADIEHVNILNCLSGIKEKKAVAYALFEYIDGCDLLTFITERTPTVPRQRLTRTMSDLALTGRRHIVRCVLQALEYLHANEIVHNDLKPENIMIGAPLLSRVNERTAVKLIDFGLAYRLDELQHNDTVGCGGSMQWIPPEKVSEDRSELGCAGDIYTFGLIVYGIMMGHMPYEVPEKVNGIEVYLFLERELLHLHARIVDSETGLLARRELKQVLLATLKFNGSKRKTATQLLQLEFFVTD